MYKAQVWAGPTAVGEVTAQLRAMFGAINVLQGTEHAYVVNFGGERDELRRDIQTAVRWLKPGDVRIARQSHRMRAKAWNFFEGRLWSGADAWTGASR